MSVLNIEIVKISVVGTCSEMLGYLASMDIDGADSFARVGHTQQAFLETYPTREALLEDVLGAAQFQGIQAEIDVINDIPTVTKRCNMLSDICFFGDAMYERECASSGKA
jgi:hypothetical protein